LLTVVLKNSCDIDKKSYNNLFGVNNQIFDTMIIGERKINCKIVAEHVALNR